MNTGDIMECYAYALRPAFYPYLSKHPKLLAHLQELQEEQRYQIIIPLDEDDLWERAVFYFNNEHMKLCEHTIYYENTLKKAVYSMRVERERLIMDQGGDNPFIPFIKRIFRTLYLCDEKELG